MVPPKRLVPTNNQTDQMEDTKKHVIPQGVANSKNMIRKTTSLFVGVRPHIIKYVTEEYLHTILTFVYMEILDGEGISRMMTMEEAATLKKLLQVEGDELSRVWQWVCEEFEKPTNDYSLPFTADMAVKKASWVIDNLPKLHDPLSLQKGRNLIAQLLVVDLCTNGFTDKLSFKQERDFLPKLKVEPERIPECLRPFLSNEHVERILRTYKVILPPSCFERVFTISEFAEIYKGNINGSDEHNIFHFLHSLYSEKDINFLRILRDPLLKPEMFPSPILKIFMKNGNVRCLIKIDDERAKSVDELYQDPIDGLDLAKIEKKPDVRFIEYNRVGTSSMLAGLEKEQIVHNYNNPNTRNPSSIISNHYYPLFSIAQPISTSKGRKMFSYANYNNIPTPAFIQFQASETGKLSSWGKFMEQRKRRHAQHVDQNSPYMVRMRSSSTTRPELYNAPPMKKTMSPREHLDRCCRRKMCRDHRV